MNEKLYIVTKHSIEVFGYRPWGILEKTKFGYRIFDIYFSKEAAETAAKFHGLTLLKSEEEV